MCGLRITLDGETIERIEGDKDDVFSRGHICPKAVGLADLHTDPDRLKTPVQRRGSQWDAIGWDEAFDLVADRLTGLQTRHGPGAVAIYTGNPAAHNYGTLLHGQLLMQALSTPNAFSATSLDQLPHMLAAYKMFGHQLRLPIPDLDRTEFLVIVGANPAVSNGSLMTAGDVKAALRSIQQRGGRIVLVDPRRTETSRLADEHLFIRPGTDAAFFAAWAQYLLEAHGPRLGRLAPMVTGLDRLTEALRPFTPERVCSAVGIDAPAIRKLVDDFVAADKAVLYGRLGVCTQPFGGLAAWLIYAINIVAGRLDTPGGAMFPTPAVDLAELASRLGRRGSFDRRRSRVRGWPEFGGEFPTTTLADEIRTAGDGRVRGLITSAGNPVLSSPGGPRLADALGKLDFMASIDIYINETTRHADVILPPTFGIEHDHYDLIFHALAVRNSAKYSVEAWPRADDQRHDWEIYSGLAHRIYRRRPARGWARLTQAATGSLFSLLGRLEPARIIDLLLRAGPHPISLAKLKKAPHGIDLGPMKPRLPGVLETADQRIDLAPQMYVDDLPRLERRLDAPTPPLTLIGRRDLRTNNSWMHNSPRLTKGKQACTLMMHPHDAKARGLVDGQSVRVATEEGEVVVPLQIDGGLMPGVVSLPHGWGHAQHQARLRVADRLPGASSNDVIRIDIDPLTGNARLNDVPVDVSPAL